MTIHTTTDVETFDADVVGIHTTVSPPFSRSKDPDDRCSGSDRKMRRARISTDVDSSTLCELKKSFQAWLNGNDFSRRGCGFDLCGKLGFVRAGDHDRLQAEIGPQHIR